ncbi:hypothetical protein [uncultured Fibrobacter sp.]|uniref:hypothetical protein n=1 Tax=uncultured Fibrobacter sp. TaxID=261512 RepID=UPI0025DDC879|nr:hypothetical protein [uncultured Fibrobacter sp.]
MDLELISFLDGSRKTLSALASLYKEAEIIKSRHIVKKIAKFSEKPFDEKIIQDYVNSIGIDRWEEIQDIVIHQLTQAESVVKAIYERNLVESLLTRRITDAEFWRMNFILQHLFTFDIGDLVKLYDGIDCSKEQKKTFAFYQLLKDDSGQVLEGNALVFRQGFLLNDFGKKFVEAVKDA